MPRAVDGTRRKERRKKILKRAKGFWGRRHNLFRTAKDAVAKSLSYAYRDRRAKKREFRALWIARISAACRESGITYSQFIYGLQKAGIGLNRKAISNMAIENPQAFQALVGQSKEASSAKVAAAKAVSPDKASTKAASAKAASAKTASATMAKGEK
jgi:large subunit ribosomal protein L20